MPLLQSTAAKAGRLPNNLLAEKRNAARSEMTSQFRAHPKFQKVIYAIGDAYGTDTLEKVDLFQNQTIKILTATRRSVLKGR